ncbi:MAG: hypothetical protein O2818_00860 [Bacteroidetes bacterium]|nr:hypothetical protein [Bacteroidota bacterium]MDA1335413.1 hypothetical protein [Bacteroidota bacterium]
MKDFEYAVLYVFKVKPGRQEDFEEAWEAVTLAIRDQNQSGGSRLYKSSDETYWAHALWPSAQTLKNAQLDVHALNAREVMVDACESIQSLGEGELVIDCWATKSF